MALKWVTEEGDSPGRRRGDLLSHGEHLAGWGTEAGTEAATLSWSDRRKRSISRAKGQMGVAQQGTVKPAFCLESGDIPRARGLSQADPWVPPQKLDVQSSHRTVLSQPEMTQTGFYGDGFWGLVQ